jgi:hypothetical protein
MVFQKPRRSSTDLLNRGRDANTILEEFRSHLQYKLSVADVNKVESEERVRKEGNSENVNHFGNKEGETEREIGKESNPILRTPVIAKPQNIYDQQDDNRMEVSNSDIQQPSSDKLSIQENRTADAVRSQSSITNITTPSPSSPISSSSDSASAPQPSQPDSDLNLSPSQPTSLATSPSTRQSVAELIRQREAVQSQSKESHKVPQRIVNKRKPVLERWGNVDEKDEKKNDDEEKFAPRRINVKNKVPWAAKVWVGEDIERRSWILEVRMVDKSVVRQGV